MGRGENGTVTLYGGRFRAFLVAVAAAAIASWLSAGPALAQAEAGDVKVQYVDCSQVAAVAAEQNQSGDAVAVGGQYGDAAAGIANELNISVEQVNACLGSIGGTTGAAKGEITTREITTGVIASTIPNKVLPATGGPSPSLAFLAALLIVGGFTWGRWLARRSSNAG